MINQGITSYDIPVMVVNPDPPFTVYAGAENNHGVFQSEDEGNTWQDISSEGLAGVSVHSMAFTRANGGALLAGTNDGAIFYRSLTDTDWHSVAAFPRAGAIVAIAGEPKEGQFLYAGTSTAAVYYSMNGGIDWASLGNVLPNMFTINSIAVMPGKPNEVFVNAAGIGGNIVWMTKDFGANWSPVPDTTFTREYGRLAVDPSQPDVLYLYGMAGLFSTRDGGQSWAFVDNIGAPIATISGVSVSPQAQGATYLLVNGSVYSSLGQHINHWTRSPNLPAVYVRMVVPDPTDAKVAYAGVYLPNQWSVFITEDNGASWHATAEPTTIRRKFLNDTMALAVASAGTEQILYAGNNGCGVIHSLDRGKTWNTVGHTDCDFADGPKNVIDVAVAPGSLDTVFAAAESTVIYVSHDRGKQWQARKLDITNSINHVLADPKIPGRVYLIAGADGFWRSDDGGQSWEKHAEGSGGTVACRYRDNR